MKVRANQYSSSHLFEGDRIKYQLMKEEIIVQFVVFETTLDSEEFLLRWGQYEQPVHNDTRVTLQKHTMKNGKFKYVSQHRCSPEDFQFVFDRERKKTRTAEAEVRKKLAGGYKPVHLESSGAAKPGENKIILFAPDPRTDLNSFMQFTGRGRMNIYEAYFENCEYAYIFEFFVKNENPGGIVQELKSLTSHAEAGVYKEFIYPQFVSARNMD